MSSMDSFEAVFVEEWGFDGLDSSTGPVRRQVSIALESYWKLTKVGITDLELLLSGFARFEYFGSSIREAVIDMVEKRMT